MKLTPSLIYEAALDDALFAELPVLIARSFEARSCTVHWRDKAGAAEVFGHSGYFSDAQMGDYAAHFVDHDLWTESGMRQGRINKAWRTSDLVSPDQYQSSVFYNEWIRQMGDDTFHCCGSVMRTVHGDGIIGLHRGKTQQDFSDRTLAEFNRQIDHLRRMFAIRGKFAEIEGRANLLDSIFAAGHQAALLVSVDGRLQMANAAGEAALQCARFVRLKEGCVRTTAYAVQADIDEGLARAGSATDRRASTCLLQSADGEIMVASLTPVLAPMAAPSVLVTIDDRQQRLPADLLINHLRMAYRLSPAEADIAMKLADGATIQDISDQRGSAVGTVRTQVKSILEKMSARRQNDVVRLIAGLR